MPIRRNDRWGARIYDPASGQQIWLGTHDRKKDAERREREAKRDLDLGQFSKPKRIGFEDFCEEWLATLSVRDTTIADYRITCRHLTRCFGNRPLNTITAQEIDTFLAGFSRTHGAHTTRRTVTRLRQILKRAVTWGYLTSSPATELHNIPRAPSQRPLRILHPEQATGLIDATPAYWRPLVMTALLTGLRRGELFGLRWEDILWTERKLQVRYQLQNGRLVPPKSHAAQRSIDVGPALLETLSEHRKACPPSDHDLVFPTPSGRPIHASDFNRDVLKPAARRALMPDVTLHDLRHTYASALIHQGASIKYVQTAMGHASAQLTLDVYGHLLQTGGQDAARRLEFWLMQPDDAAHTGVAG